MTPSPPLTPPSQPIPYSKPTYLPDELRAVRNVLKSGWLTTGPAVEAFETAFAEKVGAKHAVSFSSGTAALIAACAAAELAADDRAITSTLSFVASANCARFFNAEVDLTDVDSETLNMQADRVEKRCRKTTRAIIAVHYAGLPADLQPLRRIARKHNAVLIEDAAHALGARYKHSAIGDCKYSDMCCFSFHPTKLITSAEGGMVTTNRATFYKRLLRFRNHGIARDRRLETWEYDCRETAFNFRLSDVHAAVGKAQLSHMDEFLDKRRRIADYYGRRFKDVPEIITPVERPDRSHAWHIYVVRSRTDRLTLTRRDIYHALRDAGIYAQVHYRPIHTHTSYRDGYKRNDFPVAEAAYDRMLSLPMYPTLKRREMTYVADTLCTLIERNRK